MLLFNHHFLRIFVVLLITVFISNTVYAGGMMVSASLDSVAVNASLQSPIKLTAQSHIASKHGEAHNCHHHDSFDQNHAHQYHGAGDTLISHQAHDQSPSHGSCSHCNHCMACYSMILYDQVNVASISSQPVLAIANRVLYQAPTTPQPNKPPIS
jgi:hypothetical protein